MFKWESPERHLCPTHTSFFLHMCVTKRRSSWACIGNPNPERSVTKRRSSPYPEQETIKGTHAQEISICHNPPLGYVVPSKDVLPPPRSAMNVFATSTPNMPVLSSQTRSYVRSGHGTVPAVQCLARMVVGLMCASQRGEHRSRAIGGVCVLVCGGSTRASSPGEQVVSRTRSCCELVVHS